MRGWYKKGTIANRFRVDMSMPVMGAGVRGSALTPTVFIKDKLSASHRMASMKVKFGTIYTPQGVLKEVMRRPNLDLMMNLFRIPRAFSVSGFGDWDVGRHSVCTAFIALKWAGIKKMSPAARNELVTLALLHDLHESVTGDILPFFKTKEIKQAVGAIQGSFLRSFGIATPARLLPDLKIADMAAFLYEIRQSSAATLRRAQAQWLKKIYARQKRELLRVARAHGVTLPLVQRLLKELGL